MCLFSSMKGQEANWKHGVAFIKCKRKRYPEIAGIAFAPVSRVVALQGADMIATESYQFAQEWLKNRENPDANAHFNEFINQDLSVGLVFDRDQIGELVQRVQEDLKRRSA
jgi:hypothetical protein